MNVNRPLGCPSPEDPPLRVSIIVPCRNESRHIEAFLDSVARQDLTGLDIEILVADGMSDDGTRELLLQYARMHPELRVIDNPARFVSHGLNKAITEATGDIIIRLDVHTEYAPDYIRHCVEELERSGCDNVGGPALTRANGFIASAIAAGFSSGFSCGGAKFHNAAYEGFVDTVTYGCWRKSAFTRFGLFDETLPRNQDDEHNFRILLAGGKIWQSPRIVSWYRPRPTLRQLFKQYFQYGFWKVAVIRKHRRPASWRHLVPVTSVAAGAVMASGIIITVLAGLPQVALLLTQILAALVGLYLAGSAVASAIAARRAGDLRLAVILPLVFATYHAAYGSGFLLGLFSGPTSRGSNRFHKLLVDLTR